MVQIRQDQDSLVELLQVEVDHQTMAEAATPVGLLLEEVAQPVLLEVDRLVEILLVEALQFLVGQDLLLLDHQLVYRCLFDQYHLLDHPVHRQTLHDHNRLVDRCNNVLVRHPMPPILSQKHQARRQ